MFDPQMYLSFVTRQNGVSRENIVGHRHFREDKRAASLLKVSGCISNEFFEPVSITS